MKKIRIELEHNMRFKLFEGSVDIGDYEIFDEHFQQCCEDVYADWGCLKGTTFCDEDFNYIEIENVEDTGFKINGYFVACYNEQNGYYSDELEIVVERKSTKERVIVMEVDKEDI
ncbi:MAG: hypothetical protein ACRC4M_04285 [Mycoplasma sp.]